MIRHKDYLLVGVPEGAKNWVHNNTLHSRMDNGQVNRSRKPLPPGTWQLIGLTSELEHSYLQMIEFDEVAFTHGLKENTTVILKLIQP